MKTPQYITLGPEHMGSSITAFGERWFVGKLDGSSCPCGFGLEDIGKRLYLVDGHLVLASSVRFGLEARRVGATLAAFSHFARVIRSTF